MTWSYWVIIAAVLLPLLGYIWVGLSSRARAKKVADYLTADEQVEQNDYANTSVGYALQMAAVFLFTMWGVQYGIGALWTAVFWGLGYLLLWWLIPRFMPFREVEGPTSMHEYLRRTFGAGRGLQWLAAFATCVGLLGAMFAEVGYVVQAAEPLAATMPVSSPLVFEAVILALGLLYVIWNGFKAEVVAERVQVPLAYCGIIGTIIALIPQVWRSAGAGPASGVCIALGIALSLLALAKVNWGASKGESRFTDWQIALPIAGIAVLAIVFFYSKANVVSGNRSTILSSPIAAQLKAQGFLGLLSLFLANVLWMPVDASTWQRIESVKKDRALAALRWGTLRVALESPVSWVLGAVLGWTISGTVALKEGEEFNPITPFVRELFAGSLVGGSTTAGHLVYAMFLAASVAVMASTISGILCAVVLTLERDLMGGRSKSLGRMRLVTTGALIGGFVIFEVLRQIAGADLPVLLYGAYAAQLSLAVVVFLALFRRRLNARGAMASVVTGLVATAGYVTYAVVSKDQTHAYVLPPFFALVGAILGYAVGFKLPKETASATETTKS